MKLISITGVTKEEDNYGIICLVLTDTGLEQAVISCNARYHKAIGAMFDFLNKSISAYDRNIQGMDRKVKRLRILK